MAYFTGPNKSVKRVSRSSSDPSPSSTPSPSNSPSSMSTGMRIFLVVLGVAIAGLFIYLFITYLINRRINEEQQGILINRRINEEQRGIQETPYVQSMKFYHQQRGMTDYMKKLRGSVERR